MTPLLHYIPRGVPEYTDHGILHTVDVLRYIDYITREYPAEFTTDEKYILALSSIFHDIGCIIRRENHNESSVEILSGSDFDSLRMDLGAIHYRALTQVILAHSRKFDLMSIGPDPSPEIRLTLIGAIFRLADACDQSSRRVKELLFRILTKEKLLDAPTQAIWNAHLNVENIVVRGTIIEPRVYSYELAKRCLDDLCAELPPINQALYSLTMPPFAIQPIIVEKAKYNST